VSSGILLAAVFLISQLYLGTNLPKNAVQEKLKEIDCFKKMIIPAILSGTASSPGDMKPC